MPRTSSRTRATTRATCTACRGSRGSPASATTRHWSTRNHVVRRTCSIRRYREVLGPDRHVQRDARLDVASRCCPTASYPRTRPMPTCRRPARCCWPRRRTCASYYGNEYYGPVRQRQPGDHAWPGQATCSSCKFDNPDLQFVVPGSGGMLWVDNMMHPQGRRASRTTRYAMMDYVYDARGRGADDRIRSTTSCPVPGAQDVIRQHAEAAGRGRRPRIPADRSPTRTLVFPTAGDARHASTTTRSSTRKRSGSGTTFQRDHPRLRRPMSA